MLGVTKAQPCIRAPPSSKEVLIQTMSSPLSPEIIEVLRQFDSPTISNAIEGFRVRDLTEGYASMELRCHFPDLRPMVGYALTCTADSTTPGPKRPSGLHDVFDLLAAAPKPAVIVIKDVGRDTPKSCVAGDMICAAYHRLGAVGLVTDAGVRDLPGIRRRAPDFHVFAPGTVVSHGSMARLDLNVPVTLGGLPINPGDLLHGDETGLVKVPIEIAESVAQRANEVRAEEEEMFAFLGDDSVSVEGLKQRFPA